LLLSGPHSMSSLFFFQAEDGIRDRNVTGVQTCALPIYGDRRNIAWHMKSATITTSLFLLSSIHGRIRPGKAILTGNEPFPSGTRSHRVIADGQFRVFFGDSIVPCCHIRLLSVSALPRQC